MGLANRYAGETAAPVAALEPNPHSPRLRHGHTTSPRAPSISPPLPSTPLLFSPNEDPLIRRGSIRPATRISSGVAVAIHQDSHAMAAAAADSADPAVATSTCAHW